MVKKPGLRPAWANRGLAAEDHAETDSIAESELDLVVVDRA
jgi:hypothetical protein